MNKIRMIIVVAIPLLIFGALIKFYYFDIYLISMNGKIENIEHDIKQAMYIKVNDKVYNLAHQWPLFQIKAEVGDSVIKKSKECDLILIKKSTGQKILCNYDNK